MQAGMIESIGRLVAALVWCGVTSFYLFLLIRTDATKFAEIMRPMRQIFVLLSANTAAFLAYTGIGSIRGWDFPAFIDNGLGGMVLVILFGVFFTAMAAITHRQARSWK